MFEPMQIVDRMPMLDMLRYVLTHLYHSQVTKAQVRGPGR